jgi:phytoene dehydrogenase-like protein
MLMAPAGPSARPAGKDRAACDAVVVGAGPNGLAAAVTLATAGLSVTVLEAADEIGGGTRTAELTVPGLAHDICSAVHPLGAGSPYLASLPLADHGLTWCWPEVDLAHPLDDGTAAVLVHSLDETAAGLGPDGPIWRRSFGPLVDNFDAITDDALGPLLRIPHHPLAMARFGLRAGLPATTFARRFSTDAARALFAGSAAHLVQPLNRMGSAAVGVTLTTAGHAVGWPVAAGGSSAITAALASLLTSLGGTIHTGVRVGSLSELPPHRLALFDTSPTALATIAGDRMPNRTRRAYQRWRYGPSAYKVDLAVSGGVPWMAEACRRAGTVHVGGTLEQIVAAEADVAAGRMPTRPFVLVAQQYLADPGRSVGDVHPVWAYAHVPHGFTGDATDVLLDQIERFAPGTRDRIVGMHVTGPVALETYNANYVGGDIATGANSLRQMLLRPRAAIDPYATGIDGTYLCSAATPPGAGVHGMCGVHAATRALRHLGLPAPVY